MSSNTSSCSFIATNNSILGKSITVNRNRQTIRKSILWGSVNAIIFIVLLYDALNSCPLYFHYYDYIEYAFIVIIGINLTYYASQILIASINLNSQQILVTSQQKKLLGIKDTDPNYKVVDSSQLNIQTSPRSFTKGPSVTVSTPSSPNTPVNWSAHSWRSPNESLNYSLASASWLYHKPSSEQVHSSHAPVIEQYKDTSGIDFISDESDLEKYLKDFEVNTSTKNLSNQIQQPSNLLSSFWSHPVTKTAKDMSSFLKKSSYQLSSQFTANLNSSSPKGKIENQSSPTSSQTSALIPWIQMNVDIVTLTQWNENLRKWFSQTVLERLVQEFDRVNESLEKMGLTDIKIGRVGLDRLRKTAQMTQVAECIPSLSTLIPFLEITSNQEYLEKRIRELAKGGCMSEFKWNGGSSYNGKEWDESLPTDSAIIMHLLASYLDTQLMPLPSMPDTKPFSGLHYIKCKDKVPPLTPNSLYIQQVFEKPPHYRVIVGETIYEMVKGYNNLFHSILFFLYHVNKKEHGMLGRVNLGRAGVNMLWIIDQ